MKKIIYKIQIFVFLLMASIANAQLPLSQGSVVITHSGQNWQNLQGGQNCTNINSNVPASTISPLAILNASNTSAIGSTTNPSFNTLASNNWNKIWTRCSGGPANQKPVWYSQTNWTEQTLGRIFGLTLDACGNIYVANTSIRNGEGNPANPHDAILQVNGISGAITTVFTFTTATDPQKGIGNIKYFKVGSIEYMAVTWWEDNTINILVNKGTCAKPNWKIHDRVVIPSNIGIPYGVAYRKNPSSGGDEIYFGVIQTPASSSTIYSLSLNPSINFSGSSTSVVSLNNLNPLNFSFVWAWTSSVCNQPVNIPVSDISFSTDYKKMLAGEQDLCCTNQISAHNATPREFIASGSIWIPSTGKFPAGIISGTSSNSGTNGAGGVCYSNNILFKDKSALSCDTTALYTSDGVYVGNDASLSQVTTCLSSTYYVYGFQGLPSRNNLSPSNAYNFSLKVDADDDYNYYDKWSLGDIEAFNLPVICTPKEECICGKWDSIGFNNNAQWWVVPNALPTISFNQGQATGVLFPNYSCSGNNCSATFAYSLTSTSGASTTLATNPAGGGLNLTQLNNLPCGSYFLNITPTCNGVACPPIRIPIVIVCPPACNCDGQASINQGQVSVTTQNNISNANPVSTATTSFTLSSSTPVAEVRVLIDEFRLTTSTGNENCMLCKNKPQTWANINTGNLSGVSLQPMSLPATFPPALEKNIRELVFNNGVGSFFNLSGNTLNLTLGVPGVTGLNCCTLKAEVCVKFIIRDVKCCEKEILKCFSFNLQ